MSGSFFGKGCHLQKEASGGVEGLAVTTVERVATLCSTAVISPEVGAWVLSIQRAVGGSLASLSNPRDRRLKFIFLVWMRQNRACGYTSSLLYDTMCDRQLSFSLSSLPFSEIKGKVKGEVILQRWW